MTRQPHGPGRPAPATDPAEASASDYRLLDIQPTQPPDGSSGEWFAYRILQGTNMIRGLKSGSSWSITADVEQIVEVLNERRLLRRGRTDLARANKP